MDRRGFIGALLALPFVGTFASWLRPKIAWYAVNGYEVLNKNWYCIIHPDAETGFKNLLARNEWVERYRKYRIARRSGLSELSAKQIMADWKPLEFPLTGEVGCYENVRFIVTETVNG